MHKRGRTDPMILHGTYVRGRAFARRQSTHCAVSLTFL